MKESGKKVVEEEGNGKLFARSKGYSCEKLKRVLNDEKLKIVRKM